MQESDRKVLLFIFENCCTNGSIHKKHIPGKILEKFQDLGILREGKGRYHNYMIINQLKTTKKKYLDSVLDSARVTSERSEEGLIASDSIGIRSIGISTSERSELSTQVIESFNALLTQVSGVTYTRKLTKQKAKYLKKLNKYSLEDFELVFKYWIAKWWNEPNMKQYLRIITLCNEKFEDRLEQAREWERLGKSPADIHNATNKSNNRQSRTGYAQRDEAITRDLLGRYGFTGS